MKRLHVLTLFILSACLLCTLPGCDGVASSDESQAELEATTLSWRERYLQLARKPIKVTGRSVMMRVLMVHL